MGQPNLSQEVLDILGAKPAVSEDLRIEDEVLAILEDKDEDILLDQDKRDDLEPINDDVEASYFAVEYTKRETVECMKMPNGTYKLFGHVDGYSFEAEKFNSLDEAKDYIEDELLATDTYVTLDVRHEKYDKEEN